jgi:purine-binding chemotaxis protein CheW
MTEPLRLDLSQTANAAPGETEYLSFGLGENEYSVDFIPVREIRGWTSTTSLPHSPDYVSGVINLRGAVLPVIDLAVRLGLPATDPEDRNVIIVVDVESRTMGLRVDAVSDILTLSQEQLHPPPDLATSQGARFVKALTILDDRMVRILDLAQVLPSNSEISL